MGCSACAASAARKKTLVANNVTEMVSKDYRVPQESCEITDQILNNYKAKLSWFKDSGNYIKYNVAASVLNKYLGIVITSLNVANKCSYKNEVLGPITNMYNLIIGIQNV